MANQVEDLGDNSDEECMIVPPEEDISERFTQVTPIGVSNGDNINGISEEGEETCCPLVPSATVLCLRNVFLLSLAILCVLVMCVRLSTMHA